MASIATEASPIIHNDTINLIEDPFWSTIIFLVDGGNVSFAPSLLHLQVGTLTLASIALNV